MQTKLVAHRGYAAKYPENTLEAVLAALQLGVAFVEIDLQWSRDGIPMLLHDIDFQRTAAKPDCIFDLSAADAAKIIVNEPNRLGNTFQTSTPAFSELVTLMRDYPEAGCLVELKTESLDRFGMETCVASLMHYIDNDRNQFPFISYSQEALHYAKQHFHQKIGWVLTHYNATSLQLAEQLQPDFLICNHRKIPKDLKALPQLGAAWVFYEVEDLHTANWLTQLGCTYLETMNPGAFISHET